MPEVNGVRLPFIPAGGVTELKKGSSSVQYSGSDSAFGKIFTEELQKVKFSAHAQSRLISRDINLSNSDVERITNAVVKAEEKGSVDSLIMLGDKGFIVNIPNKTVITVVNKDNMDSNIITDIDSAVFA